MNKTIIITGSTDGIGKLTALRFAKEGHRIYIHGRSEGKINSVVSEIKEFSNNQKIEGLVADFSQLTEVSGLAEKIKREIPKIDILINNAGIYKSKDTLTDKGLDYRIVVNYLAPYLLTNSILTNIKSADSPRIINLSSAAQSPVSESVLSGREKVENNLSYAQSKLALTMWSFYLAKQEPNITIIALNPGSLLNTKMVQEAFGQHWSSAEKGMKIMYDLSLGKQYKSKSGSYYDNDKGAFSEAHDDAYNQKKIDNLLTLTDSLLA